MRRNWRGCRTWDGVDLGWCELGLGRCAEQGLRSGGGDETGIGDPVECLGRRRLPARWDNARGGDAESISRDGCAVIAAGAVAVAAESERRLERAPRF